MAREQLPVPRIPRGKHAIEQVDASCDRLHKIFGSSRAHQVARLIVRQKSRRALDKFIHERDRFAYAETADGVPLEADVDSGRGAVLAQILKDAPLDDPELHLTVIGRAHFIRRAAADDKPSDV